MLTAREIEVLSKRREDMTQEAIAQELGISQAAVSGFENNAKRKIADAKKTIAKARELGYS